MNLIARIADAVRKRRFERTGSDPFVPGQADGHAEAHATRDDLSVATLRRLRGSLRFWNATAASLHQPAQELLDQEQKRIDELYAWVATIEDSSVRHEFNKWITFAQHGLDEANREMKVQTQRIEHNAYRERERLKAERVAKLLPSIPQPPLGDVQ